VSASLEQMLGLKPAKPAPSPGRERTSTPTGRELHAFLQNGIAEIERRPMVADDAIDGDSAGGLPIDALLYRGRAALDRARVLRDEIRRAETAGEVASREALSELLDLIDLAATA